MTAQSNTQDRRPVGNWRFAVLPGLVLAVIALSLYWQVGGHAFINLDDNVYVYDNSHIATGISVSNIAWAFTSLEAANWHPLTWLSHMLDVQLYGLNAGGHHISSVVIHAAAAVLLLLLLYRLTGAVWQSALVAALFALHPMHVESVAWVAERKDVLSAFFWFLTLLLYAGYASTRRRSYYLLTLLSFALGLMAKPMLVTLPLVMLLLDVWPLKRVEGLPSLNRWSLWLPLVKEKIPFFVLSLLSAAITIHAQRQGEALKSLDAWGFGLRLENAVIATVRYMELMFWPHDMAVYYPYAFTLPAWKFIGSIAILVTVTALVLWARRRHPYLVAGWLWFLITLAPVIGLVQVGSQAMADRYTYIPYTGLFIMLAWGVPAFTRTWPHRQTLHALLAGVGLSALASVTLQQIGYWRDGIALYGHALQVTSGNSLAHNNLGRVLDRQGDPDAAISEYRKALAINPGYHDAHNNLGLALAGKGDLDGAIGEYLESLTINPNNYQPHFNLAMALDKKGELEAAIGEFQAALAIRPDHHDGLVRLGIALAKRGDLDAAIKKFEAAQALQPNDPNAYYNLGLAFEKKGDLPRAIGHYKKALAIQPDYYDAYNNLGIALENSGDLDEAIKALSKGIALNPGSDFAHLNLGVALARKGEMDGAITQFRVALTISPDNPNAHYNLGFALKSRGDRAAAISEFREALRLKPDSAEAQRELTAVQSGRGLSTNTK